MLVTVLRFFVRIAVRVFCPNLVVKNHEISEETGPTLIVANHPNSFLDAIIIGSIYKRKLHYLARADVFNHPIANYLLRQIGMIPIYRQREGKEHLHKNASTFDESVAIIKSGGCVLLFIEGLCLNTHHLLPFKKGASRILEGLQQEYGNPAIHVISLGYNDFHSGRKSVNLTFNRLVNPIHIKDPKDRLVFNMEVQKLMTEGICSPTKSIKNTRPWWFFLVSLYYDLIKNMVAKKTNGTVFYDSVLFALLFFTFPVYVIGLLTVVISLFLIIV